MAFAPRDNVGLEMTGCAPPFGEEGDDDPHATHAARTTPRRIRSGNLTRETLAVPTNFSRL
jgi:hypothetical protein